MKGYIADIQIIANRGIHLGIVPGLHNQLGFLTAWRSFKFLITADFVPEWE